MELVGQTFGRLTVLRRAGKDAGNRQRWRVRCTCENVSVVKQGHLRSGHTRSCGCLNLEQSVKNGKKNGALTKHGEGTQGKTTKEYRAWIAMRQRCLDSNARNYKDYGGRGVTICKRWLQSYHNFLADVGRAPGFNYSIDRINVNGNYTPRNVRWATPKTQANNRRVRQCA